MRKYSFTLLSGFLSLLIMLLPALPAHADILFPYLDNSIPLNGETNLPREQGRKGLQFPFCYQTEPPGGAAPQSNCNPPGTPIYTSEGFPLNLTSATVTLRIGLGTAITCTPGITPAPNNCSYSLIGGEDGINDIVKIFYNGDFPGGTTVQYSVTGARSSTGILQAPSEPNIVNFTTGVVTPRSPVSIEAVIDISGSMGWQTTNTSTITRIEALKQAAQALFATLKAHARLGDKIGSVYFSDSASAFDPVAGGTNLGAAHDSNIVNAIQGNLELQVPTNATSIGAGLQSANTNGFTADTAAVPSTRKAIILFSDGEQNTNPIVNIVGTNLQLTNGGAAVTYPADITICPVTLGQQTAPGFALMQQVADLRCSHRNAHIESSQETFVTGDIETFFEQLLTELLIGDKLEVAINNSGKIARGKTIELPFMANAKDVSLSVLISWVSETQTEAGSLTFQLVAPNGTPINLSPYVQFGRNMSFVTLPIPLTQQGKPIQHRGKWILRLLGRRLRSPEVKYHMMALLDNKTLVSNLNPNIRDAGTGEVIPVIAKLTDGGKPILNATVTTKIDGPVEGLGDILSRIQTPTGQTTNPNGEKLNALQQKLLHLQFDPEYAGLFKTNNVLLPLLDNGAVANGDAVAGDGIYTALFRGALEEGHYNFTLNATGHSANNGDFQRTQTLSTFVRPKPCGQTTKLIQKSPATLSKTNSSVPIDFFFEPKDCLGNKLGPGYNIQLTVSTDQGQQVLSLQDSLDGKYSTRYLLPPGVSDAKVSVDFVGSSTNLQLLPVVESNLTDLGFRLPQFPDRLDPIGRDPVFPDRFSPIDPDPVLPDRTRF